MSLLGFAHSFDSQTREWIVGILVNLNLVFFYGAPLSTIYTVLTQRNTSSIHIRTMITNTLNGTFWFAYGLAVSDLIVGVPNGLGTLLGVIQIVMVVLYPRRSASSGGGVLEILEVQEGVERQDVPETTTLPLTQNTASALELVEIEDTDEGVATGTAHGRFPTSTIGG
jgi:hypothetical protein